MKKFFKLFLILLCLVMLSFSAVYAVDIDMNRENENIQNNVSNDTIPRNEVSNNTTSPVSNSNVNAPAKTSTTTTSEDFHLSVSDIINIILIAVGIVLILLAIAILIRLK